MKNQKQIFTGLPESTLLIAGGSLALYLLVTTYLRGYLGFFGVKPDWFNPSVFQLISFATVPISFTVFLTTVYLFLTRISMTQRYLWWPLYFLWLVGTLGMLLLYYMGPQHSYPEQLLFAYGCLMWVGAALAPLMLRRASCTIFENIRNGYAELRVYRKTMFGIPAEIATSEEQLNEEVRKFNAAKKAFEETQNAECETTKSAVEVQISLRILEIEKQIDKRRAENTETTRKVQKINDRLKHTRPRLHEMRLHGRRNLKKLASWLAPPAILYNLVFFMYVCGQAQAYMDVTTIRERRSTLHSTPAAEVYLLFSDGISRLTYNRSEAGRFFQYKNPTSDLTIDIELPKIFSAPAEHPVTSVGSSTLTTTTEQSDTRPATSNKRAD